VQRLKRLKLQDDEYLLLQASVGPEQVVAKLLEIQAEQLEKSSKRSSAENATAKFVNSFSAFANSISHIVTILLPQSPEYSVTFGILFILFKVEHRTTTLCFASA
jgi:hypothetical protein